MSRFIHPAERPTARITAEIQTAADAARERRSAFSIGDGGKQYARVSPPGRYLALRLIVDYPNGTRAWKCVMSDTPAEYTD